MLSGLQALIQRAAQYGCRAARSTGIQHSRGARTHPQRCTKTREEYTVLALQLSLTSAAALCVPVRTTARRPLCTDSLALGDVCVSIRSFQGRSTAGRSRGVEEGRSLLAEAAVQDPARDPRWGVLAGTEQARAGCRLGFASVWDPKLAPRAGRGFKGCAGALLRRQKQPAMASPNAYKQDDTQQNRTSGLTE